MIDLVFREEFKSSRLRGTTVDFEELKGDGARPPAIRQRLPADHLFANDLLKDLGADGSQNLVDLTRLQGTENASN